MNMNTIYKLSNLKFLAFFVMTTSLSTVAKAQKSCWDPALAKAAIPICNSSAVIAMPDASKPTAAVFLTYMVSINDEVIVAAYDQIKKNSVGTKLNLLVSKAGIERFKYYAQHCIKSPSLERYDLCRMQDVLNDHEVVNVITLSKEGDEVYPQDYLQFGIRENVPVLFPTVNPWETMDYIDARGQLIPKSYIQDDVASQCGIKSMKLDVSRLKGHSSTMGGNIEALPNGLVARGGNANSNFERVNKMTDLDLLSQLRKNYPPSIPDAQIKSGIQDMRDIVLTQNAQNAMLKAQAGNPIQIDTTLAPVGHADEMFAVVKSKNKCGFSVLVPSTKVALEILKAESTKEIKSNCISKDFNGRPTFIGQTIDQLRNHSTSGCVGFRGQTYSDFLADTENLKINEQFEQVSKNNIETIVATMKPKGCSEVDIVKLPYLISPSTQANSEGVVPNPVNALIISPIDGQPSIYLNNPTFVFPFDLYIGKALESRGLIVSRITSSVYFSGQGGFHCGSSTIQLCRQK